jgi:hypothetical protein
LEEGEKNCKGYVVWRAVDWVFIRALFSRLITCPGNLIVFVIHMSVKNIVWSRLQVNQKIIILYNHTCIIRVSCGVWDKIKE